MTAVATPGPELGARLRSRNHSERWTWAALALIVAASAAFIYIQGHGTSFIRDDWNLILTRRGHSLDAFLRPHNLHLIALQVLVYKALLQVFGLTSYAPYRAVSVALHVLVTVLLFIFVRRRVGPLAALAIAALFACPGGAADDALWPFQMGFLISMAAGLGMLLALERRDPRWDLAASGLLVIALSSSGLGIAFAFAAAVDVVLAPDRWRRAARVLAIPIALYGLWWIAYGGPVPHSLVPATEPPGAPPVNVFDNLLRAPAYVFDAAGAGLVNLAGLDFAFAPTLVIAAVAALALRLVRGPRPSPTFWVLLTLAAAYWILLALARAQLNDFAATRYQYPAAGFILLLGGEAARGARRVSRASPWLLAAAAAAVIAHVNALQKEASGFRVLAGQVFPRLTALEVARGRVDPSFRPFPDANAAAPDVVAGPYFNAVRAFGSPAPTLAELARRPDYERVRADGTLVAEFGIHPAIVGSAPVPGGPSAGAPGGPPGAAPGGPPGAAPPIAGAPPLVARALGGEATAQGACVVLQPDTLGASIEVRVPPTGLAVSSSAGVPIALRVRQLASGFGDPLAVLAAGRTAVLHFPPDGLAQPWYLRIDSGQQVRACRVG